MIAGADDPAAVATRNAVAAWGEGSATIVGTPLRAPSPWAALVNGTAADALDYDDFDTPAASHPSAVIVPALLALGEERGVSGHALLDAFIVGVEAQMRIGEAVNMSHFHRGWHSTVTIGTLGASVACARLMGLDASRSAAALSLATSMAAGYKCQLGTMAIHLHPGLAAKNGILAAALANSGTTASAEALDGNWSFLTLLCGDDAKGFDAPLAKLGEPLAIEEHGLHIKLYPCCSYINRTIDGVLALRASHGFTVPEVEGVTITIPGRNAEILTFPEPRDAMQARFSMEYCVAVAIERGSLTVADFTPESVARPEVRTLLPLVRMQGHPITDTSSDLATQEPDVIRVRLKGGREFTKSVGHARGSPELPLSEGELMAKFDDCANGVLDENGASAVKAALTRFDSIDDVGDLTRHLRVA